MNFSTPISIPPSPWSLTYNDRILMLGSCFSDAVAAKMQQYYLHVTANPFHTLYNPVSIANHMSDDLLSNYDVVILTWGTAWVYEDRATGLVVDNCQKRPANDFLRRRLTVEEIVALWKPILERYQDKRFIFTVSPIRHLKDGLHANNLSKAILLLAQEQLIDFFRPARMIGLSGPPDYFPSYEILMDELRDYRFYAEDMLHPSSVAVDYIWERFAAAYLTDTTTQSLMRELHQLWLDENHRPLHPESEEYRLFKLKLEKRRQRLLSQLKINK